MKTINQLHLFLNALSELHQLTPVHIGLYVALLYEWEKQGHQKKFSVSKKEIMMLSKIKSLATYYKTIKQLEKLGFIHYIPSYNPFKETEIMIIKNPGG